MAGSADDSSDSSGAMAPAPAWAAARIAQLEHRVRELESEAARQPSGRLLAQAEAMAHVGSWRRDQQTGEVTWSDELCRIFGYEPGTVQPSPALTERHLLAEDRPRLDAEIARALAEGSSWRVQVRIRRADGALRVLDSRGQARRDAAGRVVTLEGSAQDVTEIVEAEAKLRAVVEQSLAGIYVMQDDRLTYVNPTFARVFGATPAQLLAVPDFRTLVAPDDRDFVSERVRRRLDGTAPSGPYTFHVRRLDGEERAVEVHGVGCEMAGRPAIVGILLDVTERRRAECALRQSEERFRLVARATSDVVYDWSVATGAIWWSEGLQALFGHVPTGDVGDFAWWETCLHPDDRARVVATLEAAVAAGQPWQEEYRFRRADGSWATVLDRGFTVGGTPGQPERVIGSMMDISEREALAAQLRHAQKMEAVGRLAGGIAHDFNNVLTAIMSTAELALEELPAAHAVRADLEEIRTAGTRAAALTRQLLAFSRRQVLRPEPLDPNEVVADAERLLRRVIGAQVTLDVERDPTVGLVHADRGQLEQVLVNLVVNARDAMPDGGTLTIALERHDVLPEDVPVADAAPPGRYVAIVVRDTGIGMDEATRARVFEPFFTTKPVGQGTGLGLATVYGIARQSGGFVRVRSAPGAGTAITVCLPVSADPAPAPAREPRVPGEPASVSVPRGEGMGGTILLVEDETAVRRATRRILEQAGYRVLEAADGEAALERFAAHADAVRLVLSDIVMPRLGGPALVERLRARGATVPVVLMSGYDGQPSETRRAGTGAVLAKPFAQAELLATVRAALGPVD